MTKENNVFPIRSNDEFIATTRPLISADTKTMLEILLELELRNQGTYGSASKILKLQQTEILNEIALRN
tara:strand:- start:560 stop:766 length:207 start_codon:yes stop_codon:yes gene_type:complete